jgi:hypothetical protein
MKTLIQGKKHFNHTLGRSILVIAFVLGLTLQGFAALGGSLDSVQADQAYMNATIKIARADSYAVHEIKTPTGTVVREYVSPAGRVFGIAWQGPFVPDMRLLLGTYFEHYSEAAKAQRERHVGRWPLNIQESDLVVQTAGHMRAYSGRAYDPGLLPEGVSGDDVR